MKVVGVEHGKSKNGTSFTVLHILDEFDEWKQANHECIGMAVNSIYLPFDAKVDMEKPVEVLYTVGYGGKAVAKAIVQD